MKKKFFSGLVATLLISAMLTGCGGGAAESGDAANAESTGDKLKVSLLVTGSFGDKAFNDSAQEGMKKIQEELSDQCEVEMIEMGNDKTKFEGSLLDASDSDSDVIIVGTWDMKENLERVAPEYPDKKYIIFDTDVDYSLGLDNVYSMSYKQNEAAFLAGVLAAGVTTSDMEFANEDATIGFVGAKDTAAVINDSAVGYIEGAKFMNPDIKVLVSYVGSYTDSATAKELALTQYSNGADCIFVAAGPASVGVIEAGAESQKYVIGVDSDQAMAYEGKEEANYIISSAIKGVGISIYNSIVKELAGELPYGTYEQLGLADGAVGLAENDIYNSVVPEDIRGKVEEAKQKILNGEVTVSTAYGMDEATLKELVNSAQ
ncbi:BMP family ABC transporter substrate-binding protein [Anaerotignum sp.]|uniref:BMP family ABC transporter substrate-binding protein n=1 Tax=Anaerotignum sp. TaxID=2039241 RepID=UPI002A91B9C5|nr:BMP family ABC transporter substrate-binding protein [Anaerotignum sp.]MCI7656645.1 BMP family ABC transporter substrate-binding protein [Clostridia bacterium]MDY5414143.1 BMP family ABC transporter substrate-binding protein [Anaerotignum sp.]